MPQGKGTYGSKVGRPKKKKYNKGGKLKGKKHKQGGIPILAEGGEIIINISKNKASKKHEKGLLAINNNPDKYAIVDARTRKEIK